MGMCHSTGGRVTCLQALPANLPASQAWWQGRPRLPTSSQAGPVDPQTQSRGTFGQKVPRPQAGFGPPTSSGPSLLSSLPPKLLAQAHSSSGGRERPLSLLLRETPFSRFTFIFDWRARTPHSRCAPPSRQVVRARPCWHRDFRSGGSWREAPPGAPSGCTWLSPQGRGRMDRLTVRSSAVTQALPLLGMPVSSCL